MSARRQSVVLRLSLGVVFLLAGAQAQGQVFRIGAGSSSLFQAQGGMLEVRGRNYEGWVGVGEANGRLRLGLFGRFQYHKLTFRVGDDNLKFEMPTDIFGSNHYFQVRGVGVTRTFGNTKVLAFGGTTSTTFGSPFFRVADMDQPVGLLFVDTQLSPKVKAFSRNVVAQSRTSIHGLEWKTRPWLTTSVAVGMGSGERYFAVGFDADRDWISLKGSYIEAGNRFRRIQVDTPVSTEVDGANLVATVRPWSNVVITAGHQNFLEPNLSGNQDPARATVNNLQGSATLKGFRVGGGLYQSSVRGVSNLGTFLWGGRRITDRVDANLNYFHSRPENGPASSQFSAVVRETISPRIELLQLISRSNGQTTMSFGGHFLSNRFTIGVDYQTLYMPFSPTPFTQAVVLKVRFRPFGNVDLNAQTYVTPDGKLRYTAFGNTSVYRYGGLRVGEGSLNFKLENKIIRGRVVDEKNEPVNGAALRIGKELVFSDVQGQFFLRVNKARAYTVKVVTEEFILPGYFEVVSAPAQVQAVAEDSPEEIVIVVRRVSPPKRPTHTAEKPAPAAPASDGAAVTVRSGAAVTARSEVAAPAKSEAVVTAKSKAAAPARSEAAVTARPGAYVVQVAAFQQADRAQAMVATLQSQSFPAFVSKDAAAGALNRVLIGPVGSAVDAEVFRRRLEASGYQALVKGQPLGEVAKASTPAESTQPAAPVASTPAIDKPEPGAIQ